MAQRVQNRVAISNGIPVIVVPAAPGNAIHRCLNLLVTNLDTVDADVTVQLNDDTTITVIAAALLTPTAKAQEILTQSANVIATDTVSIGGKVYTFVATPAIDGDVDVGVDIATSLANLGNAINLGPGAGTAYDVAMTQNTRAFATFTATTLTAVAHCAGTDGNAIVIAEASATLAWTGGAVNLSGGLIGNQLQIQDFLVDDERMEVSVGTVVTTNPVDATASYVKEAGS